MSGGKRWTPAEVAALSVEEFDRHREEIVAQVPQMAAERAKARRSRS